MKSKELCLVSEGWLEETYEDVNLKIIFSCSQSHKSNPLCCQMGQKPNGLISTKYMRNNYAMKDMSEKCYYFFYMIILNLIKAFPFLDKKNARI